MKRLPKHLATIWARTFQTDTLLCNHFPLHIDEVTQRQGVRTRIDFTTELNSCGLAMVSVLTAVGKRGKQSPSSSSNHGISALRGYERSIFPNTPTHPPTHSLPIPSSPRGKLAISSNGSQKQLRKAVLVVVDVGVHSRLRSSA